MSSRLPWKVFGGLSLISLGGAVVVDAMLSSESSVSYSLSSFSLGLVGSSGLAVGGVEGPAGGLVGRSGDGEWCRPKVPGLRLGAILFVLLVTQ